MNFELDFNQADSVPVGHSSETTGAEFDLWPGEEMGAIGIGVVLGSYV